MTKIDGVSAVAVVLIASFAVDRVVTAILFLLSYNGAWQRKFPGPGPLPEGEARDRAARNLKLAYFCIGAVLAIPVIAGFGKIRILAALGFPTNPYLDVLVTGLILVGGSDRVAEMLKIGSPGEAKNEPKPIAIKGEITLTDSQGNPVAARDRGARAEVA
jgi:hypothetical protein